MKLNSKIKKLIPLYTYKIEWSEEDKIFVVSVEELPGCMSHGTTQPAAMKMAQEAVEVYLESLVKHKEEIPQPLSMQKYKGEFLVRANAKLHQKLAIESQRKGYKSFNKFIVDMLSNSAEGNVGLKTATKKLA
jgi:predicted RNase H-like HicB family nuclease